MDITKISAGRNPPLDLHAIIEIPVGGAPVKYEFDKASGAMFVDRFLHTAMYYPGNYGLLPQTLSQDGDPCDVLVIAPVAVSPGAVIRCRPVGALLMEDQAGMDEKIIAVPVDARHPFIPASALTWICPKSCVNRLCTSSITIKTWNKANGLASASGSMWRAPNG